MDTKMDLFKTIQMINENCDDFREYCKVYKFTTENIQKYYEHFNFENKSILTVCASGDQAINAFFKGCENIDLFDINRVSEYYLRYKVAAIKTLNYCDFFDTNNLIFTPNMYAKIRENLDHNTKFYWDSLYKYYYNKINSYYFFQLVSDSHYNYYYNERKYIELKNKINGFKYNNFYQTNIINIRSHTAKKYDLILLSNISDYISNTYNKNNKESFKLFNDFIINDMSCLLKENGNIVLAYLYDYNQDKIPKNYNYNYQMLNSGSDKILVYKKK